MNNPIETFHERVKAQIALLVKGRPLDAFDQYFSPSVMMYANNKLFASGAAEGRRKQEPFINAAVSITGRICDLKILKTQMLCVFRNHSSFVTTDGIKHQIDGLVWQKWDAEHIVEERYFDGEMMRVLVTKDVLENPFSSVL